VAHRLSNMSLEGVSLRVIIISLVASASIYRNADQKASFFSI
jgi:hypothetical protein